MSDDGQVTTLVSDRQLLDFVRESFHIEGLVNVPLGQAVVATEHFLALGRPSVEDVCELVHAYQPGARLRFKPGMDVRVGNHVAPPGGPEIAVRLGGILQALPVHDPWRTHVMYETLHPFTDGNGRSGRALWAWQMVRQQGGLPLGFLHQWYYQTLERSRA